MVSPVHSLPAVHCVVVWEWFDDALSKWLPYGPAVSQHLERAYGKQLTRVILSDADPSLVGCYVNLRTQTQCYDRPEGTTIECGVRRACYSVTSPAGRGAKWEWARALSTRHAIPTVSSHLDQVWDTLPINLQCIIEEAWARGDNSVDLGLEPRLACPWAVDFTSLSARGPGGALKNIRRIQQAPYPLTRAPPTSKPNNGVQGRRALSIMHQQTGSGIKCNQLSNSNKTNGCHHNISQRPAAKLPPEARHSPQRSGNSQPKDKNKTNLARQILHNLNIFSNKTNPESEGRSRRRGSGSNSTFVLDDNVSTALDADSSSTRSGRRPSVDTVSTYLSHESKDSCTQPPVGDLLNCSIGSDDVFEPMDIPQPRPHTPAAGSIVGVDAASRGLGAFVRAVSAAQWGAVCPLCMGRLGDTSCASPGGVVVALVHCSHMLHLSCLNETLTLQQRINKGPLFITCGVCGRAYGGGDSLLNEQELTGDQPPGSMAWTVQPRPPGPPYPPDTNTIQITYNISSGVQGPEHPTPGRPYYAVGFPRYTYLPDTPQGRKVLSLIRWAWQRRLVVTVARSATTGREHVAAWAPLLARVLAPLQRRVAAAPRRVAALHAALVALCPDSGEDDDEYQELS